MWNETRESDYSGPVETWNPERDLALKDVIEKQLPLKDFYRETRIIVTNGQVILEGTVPDEDARVEISEFVEAFPGVVEVINRITCREKLH